MADPGRPYGRWWIVGTSSTRGVARCPPLRRMSRAGRRLGPVQPGDDRRRGRQVGVAATPAPPGPGRSAARRRGPTRSSPAGVRAQLREPVAGIHAGGEAGVDPDDVREPAGEPQHPATAPPPAAAGHRDVPVGAGPPGASTRSREVASAATVIATTGSMLQPPVRWSETETESNPSSSMRRTSSRQRDAGPVSAGIEVVKRNGRTDSRRHRLRVDPCLPRPRTVNAGGGS